MIPGPTEYEPNVLEILARPTLNHTSKEFISIFSQSLEMIRSIFAGTSVMPFIVSGSGTLGMELATLNFMKKDSKVLIVNTGYFGDRFHELLSRFTDKVDVYKPPLGYAANPKEIQENVESNSYDLVTVTHVDTSTGVRNDVKSIAGYFKNLDTVLVIDGVCSIGGEEFSMDWGVDVAFTASQKALGVPPGLAVGAVNQKAMRVMERSPPLSYFSDLRKWKEIFDKTMKLEPSYFGTPAVNLICALHESLKSILDEGLENRFDRHKIVSKAFREALLTLGLKMIPVDSCANTISTPYLPDGVDKGQFLKDSERYGAVFAGGLLPDIKDKYFRIGHMGSASSSEVIISVGAIERSLKRNGYEVKLGSALASSQEVLARHDLGSVTQQLVG